MILAGIAMMYIFSASTTLLMYFAEAEAVKEAYFWMVGSLGRAGWGSILPVSITLLICMIPVVWKAWDLNVMLAGDEDAKSLGVDVEKTRIFMMIVASLITAAIISFTGTIGL